MKNILDTIADYARVRVEKDKACLSLDKIKDLCKQGNKANGAAFEEALKKPGISFICEIKKASPSKGVIDEKFQYIQIAKEYEEAKADCVSCLTEPKWFLGSDDIFREVRNTIKTPMIRKDFVVDEYQIYQAYLMGANAVLLICSILDTDTIGKYLEIVNSLGLTAIVETHDENEIRSAVSVNAKIIGVNNRNLKDFSVDINNSGRLRELVPKDTIFVAESGIKSPKDIKALADCKVDAVLIGETLMRAENKKQMLKQLRGEI